MISLEFSSEHDNENKLVSTSVCLVLGVKMQAVR